MNPIEWGNKANPIAIDPLGMTFCSTSHRTGFHDKDTRVDLENSGERGQCGTAHTEFRRRQDADGNEIRVYYEMSIGLPARGFWAASSPGCFTSLLG